ncbi:SPRY-domain-containing protein [Epithele typhae]|uniref:SPRY-domain-containing protein n=1 Tax=Epithele typhae TaxID=378194 RepID=UPI002007A85E|nr:SPRY-domain-containing protein [Epithele typhae]KAH9913132.1 SPRY-domain-containing protein [Epithele typhae]
MATRHSRSASIPIPPTSVARNLESVIPLSFNPSAPARPRLSSIGTSASPIFAHPTTSPARSVSMSYASAIATSPRGRPTGPSQASPTPLFEPRIIRAAPSPNPSRDAACNPASASPTHTRRLSSGIRAHTPHGPTAPAHRTPSSTTVGHALPQGFPRPAYLESSSLRSMLYTEAPRIPARFPVTAHDSRSSASPAPPVIPYPYLGRELTPVVDSDDESLTTSPPPTVGGVTMISTNTVLMLPTRWSEQERAPSLSVSLDGRELTFTGPSCMGDREAGAARANHAIPPACGIYYYELEILHHCPQGFSAPEIRTNRLPGWEQNTWGYHAEDGCSYAGQREGHPYGPKFDTGDVIGCGIDFSCNRVFYTKNGGFLGMVFENVGKNTELYPCIGMRQSNESVRANFGSEPFKFAIEEHIRAQRDSVWDGIMETPIDWSLLGLGPRRDDRRKPASSAKTLEKAVVDDEDSRAPLRKLVLAYLAHHGYARTARAFQAQCADRARAAAEHPHLQPQPKEVDEDVKMAVDDAPAVASAPDPSRAAGEGDLSFDYDLNTRLSITNAIIRGEIDSALALIRVHHSTVLEREQGLILFRLRCRKFVELVLAACDATRQVDAERARVAALSPAASPPPMLDGEDVVGPMDGVGAMDVDEPSPEAHPAPSTATAVPTAFPSAPSPSASGVAPPSGLTLSAPSPPPAPTPAHTNLATLAAAARASLNAALAYGQTLDADYKKDTRAGIRAHLHRTFGVVAYDDPIAAGGEVAETAGQAARNALAAEVNQAILESQGRPAHPALETLFRQASACVTQLALLGVGAAAFADVRKEFVEG